MKNQDYKLSFTVDKSPEEVFNAINNVRGWWSGDIKGDTDKLGAEFTYRVESAHYSKQKIAELIPGQKIVWDVVESNLSFITNKSEWTGTKIIFEIAKKGEKTEVTFTHVGLVPPIECYGDCSNAWGMLIKGNLYKLITTGKNQPSLFA